MCSSYMRISMCQNLSTVYKRILGSQSFVLHVFPFRSGRYDSFEGLRAEECGILNGCENGRCVRVREGYTCDCFDGYEFDLSKMACIGEPASCMFSVRRSAQSVCLICLSESSGREICLHI